MTAPAAHTLEPSRPAPGNVSAVSQPGLAHAIAAFAVSFLLLLVLVPESFGIKPASDDFAIISEIHRGTAQGVGVFFTRSAQGMNYRPFKSLTLWAFGNLFHDHPLFGIRVAHFCGLAMFAGVVLLWTRTLKLGVT